MLRPGIRAAAGIVLIAGVVAGCAPKLPAGVDEERLSAAVGRAIGSPSTCVIIADKAGKMVWRGGGYITCSRNLPSCQGAAVVTAQAMLKTSLGKAPRFASCPSGAGGANTVGWATGPVPVSEGKAPTGLSYVAVMEGERALPGREIQDRVEGAFAKAGF